MGTYNIDPASTQSYTLTGITAGLGVTMPALTGSYTLTGITHGVVWYPVVAQAMTVSDATVAHYGLPLSDTVDIAQTDAIHRAYLLLDAMAVALAHDPSTTFGVVLSAALRSSDTLRSAWNLGLSDTTDVTPTLQAMEHAAVLEALRITPVDAPSTTFGLAISTALDLNDVLARLVSGVLTESVGLTAVDLPVYRAVGLLTENMDITLTDAPSLFLAATLSEGVDITAADALTALYTSSVLEGIEIGGAYISPGDGVTAWAMNTRTRAVTEYRNFAFNSFAQMERKYLAASTDGLYELNGDTDDGTSIVASLKGGLMQVAGARFSSFKAAYLGLHGTGDFVLRLEAGDGRTYDYAVSARDRMTTKVNLGKGLRARYFSFTLTSTGQDFDLDTIEFIPILAQRRG